MVTIGDDIYMPNRVNGIIEYSIKNVDYYRNLGLKPNCSIESFPVLTKKVLQDSPGSLLSDDELSNINNLLIKSSSGSSGMPTSVYWSQNGYMQSMRTLWKKRIKFHSIYPNSMELKFTNSSLDTDQWLDIKKNGMSVSRSILNDHSKIEKLFYYINRLNIEWMYIQPYVAVNLMTFIRENRVLLPPSLRYLEFAGEMLPSEVREEAQKVFNVPVANMYGSEEMNGIAYECPYGVMHVLQDNVWVETSQKDEGEIIITSLTNYAMPLLRYKQGDIVVLDRITNCKCGCSGLVIKSILGRSYENIAVGNSQINPYILITVMEHVNNQTGRHIKQYKFVWYAHSKQMHLYIKSDLDGIEIMGIIKALVQRKLIEISITMDLQHIRFVKEMPTEFGKYSILKIVDEEV